MKRGNTFLWCVALLSAMLTSTLVNAQTFNGSILNNQNNTSNIPFTGTGGCTGVTTFNNAVAALPANAIVASVTINLTHTWDSDLGIFLQAPNGQRIELTTGNGGAGDNYTNTVFSDGAATLITAGAAPFTGNFRPEGTNLTFCTTAGNIATLGTFTPQQNGTWVLVIEDGAGGDQGIMLAWSITFATPCNFTLATLPPITLFATNPAICGVTNATITAPTITCTGFNLNYSVDGVPAGTVAPGGTFTVSLSTGVHTIRYDLPNGFGFFRLQTVTVIDQVKPIITCPANITFNLDPGECSQAYNFTVTGTDNCPGPIQSLNQNLGWPQVVDIALVCSNAAPDPISYYRVFNITQNITAQSIDLGVWRATPGSPFTIRLYALPIGVTVPNNANLTNLLSTTVYNPAAIFNATTINIPLTPTPIAAGTNLVVQITASGTAVPASGSSVGFDLAGESAPTYVYGCLATPGVPAFITSDVNNLDLFSTRGLILQINLSAPAVTISQLSGLASGGSFPIGTTQNCFLATDAAGNTSSCCFNVTVNEFANPITSLVCNDLVQISLDETCSFCMGADDILEGGPYGCYDDYLVQVDKNLPFGNGPWVPACFGPQDIGHTYQVRVVDDLNGNGVWDPNENRCWGLVKIEDKLPPVLVCPPVTIPCNADATPGAISVPSSIDFAFPPLTIVDLTTSMNTTSVTVPANYLSFSVHFVTNHTWIGDISATLTSANGNVITLFDRPGIPPAGLGCANNGIDVFFSDNAANTYAQFDATCNAAAPAISGNYQPLQPLASLLTGNPNGTWTLRVTDAVGGDIGVANVTLSFGILTPIPFPNGLTLPFDLSQTGPNTYTVNQGAGIPQLDNCSAVTLTYIDVSVDGSCATGIDATINRKWTATDASGNTGTCIQVITLILPDLSDVVCPPDYDNIDNPALPCTGTAYPTPDYIEGLGLQGYPYVFGLPIGCTIGYNYTDVVITVCDGTYKIRRQWVIIDWCTGESIECNQIIKVLDEQGPSIACPANVTVSTDPFQCCATVDLPNAIIEDNCSQINSINAMVITFDPQTGGQTGMYNVGGTLTSFPGNNLWDLDTLGNWGYTACLPVGNHTVIYTATDDCGNTTTCSFRLFVRDYTPPEVACDQFTTVAIGIDDPFDCYGPAGQGGVPAQFTNCEGAGVTWVKATTFDDGSYDNCGPVHFTVQRMSPYSDCINLLNQFNGHPDCADIFPDFPSEFERAITEYDSIKFYCCEVGTTQTVILRVYQVDVNGNISIGPDGTPIVNQCMVLVEVQDKIKPICQSPANVTVSCENFDPSLWAYGIPTIYDNCCLDTSKVYQGQCGLTHTVAYNNFDSLCNRGTITRTFRAYDCHGFSSQCTQRVIVTYEQDYWVKFPNDVIVTICDGTGVYGEPTFYNDQDCELLGVSYEDQIFTVVPDACYKIERTWTVINWCTYNPNLPCIDVPNPNPNPTVNHPSNLPGPVVSPCGTTFPATWAPTVVKINSTDPVATNFCTFWDADANCYRYKQIIKILDNQDPVVQCPASPVDICDLTANDPLFWNNMFWWDGTIGSHDLCEAPVDLCITGTDACSGPNLDIRYILFLDLNGDGVMETVISSSNLPGFNNVNFGNLNNPNFSGGTPSQFDQRPVPFNQKYGFALQQTTSGNNRTACVRWNTQQSPTTYVIPQLPYGSHKIKWIVSDGCGNETICEYTFIVHDCKKPTVVCLNGLSVNIMPTGMITLWASDFLQYTEDNCTPADQLKIGIIKSVESTGVFPVDGQGNPITSVTFTCDELGTQLVQLWSQDVAGNADFCETYVIVQDNMGNCGVNATVAGALKTDPAMPGGAQGLEEGSVQLNGSSPAIPDISLLQLSNNAGSYIFPNAVPFLGSYTVTPTDDDNPLNGVTTFDLVLMSKHILGLQPLTTPYQQIAADINKSGSITTYDIVELRKLILGIYAELPANSSWRFVDKDFTFPDPANPFLTAFPETKTVASVQATTMDEDFVSVKVGDVNGSAIANSLVSADDRSAGTLLLDVQDREVKAGEVFDVTMKADQATVQGLQFTLNLKGLEVAEIVKGDKVDASNFGVFADRPVMTASIDGATEFTVKFRATKGGKLSEMLRLSSEVTKTEAYSATSDRLEVALRFNSATGSTIAGVGFELYQNVPNPFVSKTFVGFHLPEAAEATLTVMDETGRTIYTQKGQYAKGYNAIAIDRAMINTTGVLYYKLETATDAATKKMIQTK